MAVFVYIHAMNTNPLMKKTCHLKITIWTHPLLIGPNTGSYHKTRCRKNKCQILFVFCNKSPPRGPGRKQSQNSSDKSNLRGKCKLHKVSLHEPRSRTKRKVNETIDPILPGSQIAPCNPTVCDTISASWYRCLEKKSMKNRNHKRLGRPSYCHYFVSPSEELYMLMFRIEALTGPARSQHVEETKKHV